MKGLKKIALATAVAAAPFAAQAELQAMDDSMMGNVTGQAGVTIELETQVSIGQFTYTDEGTFAVKDIELGGALASSSASAQAYADTTGAGALLDQLKIDIDVEDDGDAVIHIGSLQRDANDNPVPIDWGMTAGSMELDGNGGENTVLVSNMDAWGLLGALDIRVDTTDVDGLAGTGTLNIDAAFTVEEMSFDVDFLGVGIAGMTIRGVNDSGEVLDAATLGALLTPEGEDEDTELTNKLIGLASGAAGKSFAIARVDVYKGNGIGASSATDVLRVDIDDVLMDINIAETNIGGANIGTIGIDNLHISNTKLAVYGH